eukprot:Hpha_TRINITY_DN16710_c5_g1::TRINITY_DN16710_c5_g1_i11::g.77988::m.77988
MLSNNHRLMVEDGVEMSVDVLGIASNMFGVEMNVLGIASKVCMRRMVIHTVDGNKAHMRRRYRADVVGVANWEYQRCEDERKAWNTFGDEDAERLERVYWHHATSVRPAATAHACRHTESPPAEVAEAKVEVKSWRMDTVQGLKKEDLVKLSGSAEGKEQLRQLKEELDKCVEWCDRHPEHDGIDVMAAAADEPAEPSATDAA